MIRSGTVSEISPSSGRWAFVDLGFSSRKRSCGVLVDPSPGAEVQFSSLVEIVVASALESGAPLNLMLEAPLSVAFSNTGNPTGRSFESRPGQPPRYWYLGLGCGVLVAATYLLRAIADAPPAREIRLFEAFASFKPKGQGTSHKGDVEGLRSLVWNSELRSGATIPPESIAVKPSDRVLSAFVVAGMDFGVPPVVVLDA